MPHAIVWILFALLAAAWSLLAWATHAALAWSLTRTASGSGVPAANDLQEWLGAGLPPQLADVATAVAAALQSALAAASPYLATLAGWVTPLAWVTWALGMFALVASAGLVSLVIGFFRARISRAAA